MNFIQKLRRFMYGRYGVDQLSRFLFYLSMVFWALSLIFRFLPFRRAYYVFWALNLVIYAFAIFRILSKNTYARTVENERYLRLRGKVLPKWMKFKAENMDKSYVFRKCPHCGSRLRLKRVRGRHTARCPRCGTKFKVFILFGDR